MPYFEIVLPGKTIQESTRNVFSGTPLDFVDRSGSGGKQHEINLGRLPNVSIRCVDKNC